MKCIANGCKNKVLGDTSGISNFTCSDRCRSLVANSTRKIINYKSEDKIRIQEQIIEEAINWDNVRPNNKLVFLELFGGGKFVEQIIKNDVFNKHGWFDGPGCSIEVHSFETNPDCYPYMRKLASIHKWFKPHFEDLELWLNKSYNRRKNIFSVVYLDTCSVYNDKTERILKLIEKTQHDADIFWLILSVNTPIKVKFVQMTGGCPDFSLTPTTFTGWYDYFIRDRIHDVFWSYGYHYSWEPYVYRHNRSLMRYYSFHFERGIKRREIILRNQEDYHGNRIVRVTPDVSFPELELYGFGNKNEVVDWDTDTWRYFHHSEFSTY